MAVSGQQRRPVVALYERIADAIHDGTYPPGSTLPSEPRLAGELGVSRPALREALLLLQEDGLLSVRRGVGRTVNDRPPRRGFEQLQPLEELLGTGGPVRVRALLRSVEEPTDFTTQHLLPAHAARSCGSGRRCWSARRWRWRSAMSGPLPRTSSNGCTRRSPPPSPTSPPARCSRSWWTLPGACS